MQSVTPIFSLRLPVRTFTRISHRSLTPRQMLRLGVFGGKYGGFFTCGACRYVDAQVGIPQLLVGLHFQIQGRFWKSKSTFVAFDFQEVAMPGFVGRQPELKRLKQATLKKTASLIVVKGRRRVGKSRLIEEFAANFDHFYAFEGLPPRKDATHQDQLDEFSRQMAEQFKTPVAQYRDWGDILWAVGERVPKGKVLLFFDEISWMGSKDPDFLGKIKNAWDQRFKKNDRLVFVVCGSASAWIEDNMLLNTGFAGRISFALTLEVLPLPDCNRFWPTGISAHEKFKVLSVTGGDPQISRGDRSQTQRRGKHQAAEFHAWRAAG